jgi:FAD/FMN-containing dehydrogenase
VLTATLSDAVRAELQDVVGPSHVLVDPELTAGYAVDWTGRFRGAASAVVRPGTTQEVAAVVRACGRAGVALVPAAACHCTVRWCSASAGSTTSARWTPPPRR